MNETPARFEEFDGYEQQLIECIQSSQWESVGAILNSTEFIDEVKSSCSNNYRVTALHVALSIPFVPLNVINTIITLYPGVCLIEDEDGTLPIHLACSTPGVSFDVIRNLMIKCPQSCLEREHKDGELPLYLLLENNRSSDVKLHHLISSIPASCLYDTETSLIHEVCNDILPEAIINEIIKAYPQVCRIQDKHGDTLLHILCSHKNSSARSIRIAVNHHPEACKMMNKAGNLPLHLLRTNSQPEEVIRILLNVYPEGLLKLNSSGQVPLFTPGLMESPTKIKALLLHSNCAFVTSLLYSKSRVGLLPVQEFFYRLQCDISSMCFHQGISSFFSTMKDRATLLDKVQTMFYILRAHKYGSFDMENIGNRLNCAHKSSFWTAFPIFTKMLLLHFPCYAKEKDCNGELPLHIIAKQTLKSSCIHKCSVCGELPISGPYFWHHNKNMRVCGKCDNNPANCHASTDPSLPMHSPPLVEYQSHEILKDIVNAYPEAVNIKDCCGNLPLHVSLCAGKTWGTGIKEIFKEVPDAIHTPDPFSHLSPFMIAASKKCQDDQKKLFNATQDEQDLSVQNEVLLFELNTVFELLRNAPGQMNYGSQREK